MKRLMILLLAAGLFTACNNNKGKDGSNSTSREKEDSNSKDKKNADDKKDADNTRPADDKTTEPANNNNDKPADYTSVGKWPDAEITSFISSCVYKAVASEMNRGLAERYCNCMQVKMEQLYPDVRDLAALTDADLQTPSMQRMIKDCLK